jgi:hypothetical protein
MKKLYLGILMIAIGGISFGQNAFIIRTPIAPNSDMVTANDIIVTNDTVVYFNADEYADVSGGLFQVINPSGSSMDVKVRRTTLTTIPGAANFFCWDLCFTPPVSVSGNVTIASGDTAKVFTPDYQPQGSSGTTFVKYKFYNSADTTQYSTLIVKFVSGTVGIEDEELTISNVYPNPANLFINFDYTLGNHRGKITIADMTGKIVRTAILPENSTKQVIGLEGLTEGIYIYTFYGDNKAISAKKFIINK